MADNIEIGFEIPGLETITKNAQQLKDEFEALRKIAKDFNLNPDSVKDVQALGKAFREANVDITKTDKSIDELAKSLKSVKFEVPTKARLEYEALQKVAKNFGLNPDSIDDISKLSGAFKKANIDILNTDKSLDELRDSLKKVGYDIPNKGFGELISQISEASVDGLDFGEDLASNVSSVGDSLAELALNFGGVGIAVALAIKVLTPFVAELFEADEATKALAESTSKIISEYAEEKVALDDLFQPLSDNTLSTKDRKDAIEKLKEAYPDYLGGMDLEKASVNDLTQLYNKLNAEIINNAVSKERAAAKSKILQEQIELELKLQNIQVNGFFQVTNALGLTESEYSKLKRRQEELAISAAKVDAAYNQVTSSLLASNQATSAYATSVQSVNVAFGDATKAAVDFAKALFGGKEVEFKSKKAVEDAEKAANEAEANRKKALQERKERESKAVQDRIDGINKINAELDKEIKKLDDLSKNGSVNEVKEQQEKVLEVQSRQVKAIDDAVEATKNYIEVSKTLKDLREQDAENDRKRGLVQEEIQLKNAIEERSKAEIKALQDIVDQAGDGGALNILELLGIDKDNEEAIQLFENIVDESDITLEAIQKLREAGATFGDGFLSGSTLSDLITRLQKVQGALGNIPDKAADAATNANKNITERFVQGAKDANAAYFETLGRVDPELTKAGVKSFEQSLRFLIDERNNTAAKLINEKQGILTKFNTLFDVKALRIEDEKLLVDEQALIEARAKLTTEAELKAFDDQQSALLEVIKLANDGKQALDINFLIARNKLQIVYNDEYIAAYKKRFDDQSRLAQLEYDEATFAQEQFTSKELDDLKKSNDERKKLKKKQTKEDKDNILFAKQEALTLLERQFDEENELLQKQQLDPLNALRAKLEDADLKPEEKAAIAKKIELQQREAELAIAKAQTNQSKKRTTVSASFDNLIEEDGTETQKRIKEITEIAQASQQLIGQVFEFAIQQNQAYLDLLNEQLSGIDEQISNTQGKITELEDDLEGKRSGRRDAVLQSIELEKQREIDLANQKIALEKKIAEEQRKIRIKEQAAAIAQALINGALSITAITTVPDFTFGIASAIRIGLVAASTAAQVATIASQKFAKGGILDGASHANGGIQTPFGELEGGEAVINKNSTRMFAPLLSQINEAGGGKRFATGGILDTNSLNQNSNSASSKDVVGAASINQMNQQLMALQNRPIYVRPTEVANLAASTARMVQSTMI